MEVRYEEISSIQKLEDANTFAIWKFQVEILLKSYGLFELVKNETSKEVDLKKDAQAKKIIISSIAKKHIPLIMSCEEAKSMYEKLCFIFEKTSEQQKCNLLQEFYKFTYDEKKDVIQHIAQLQNLSQKIKSLGDNLSERMIITKIMSILPRNFCHFITAWESTPISEQTIDNLTARLITEEERVTQHDEPTAVAFKTETYKKRHFKSYQQKRCSICKKTNHTENDCYFKNKSKQCTICKKSNHQEKDCFFKNKNKNINNSHFTFFTETENFVVDSGCTIHMTNKENILKNKEDCNVKVQTAEKKIKLQSEKKGKIETECVSFDNVLYIPNLQKNLLSVNAITEKNGEVIFTKEKVIIKKNNDIVLEGKKTENGIYNIQLVTECKDNKYDEDVYLTETAEDWHLKFGHPGKETLKNIIKSVEGINIKKEDIDKLTSTCDICFKAKQTRLPFYKRNKSERKIHTIHTDLLGPITPISFDEKKYVLSLIDDYTDYTETYLLKNKNEVFTYLKQYIQEVERETNLQVSRIRCDNGGEYTSQQLKDWCKNKGIKLDYTVVYTPQQNGKAERFNRTLMEKVRAMLYQSNVEKKLWGEAVCSATYLINRIPKDGQTKTPIEKWSGKKPNAKNIKIFGSEAYAKILTPLKKLDERSEKLIMVGYAPTGYRLWNPKTMKINIRRDVVFVKNVIPVTSKGCQDDIEIRKDINYSTEDLISFEENIESVTQADVTEDKKEKDSLNTKQILKTIQKEIEVPTNETMERNKTTDEDIEEEEIETNNEIAPLSEIRRSRRIKTQPKKLKDYYTYLTYEDAITGPDKEKWIAAIQSEKNSLEDNKVWEMVDKSKTGKRKILSNKWILKIKGDGKYKARLVVRGYEQRHGIDYEETFSPVINISSIRIILAIAANKEYHITKLDIKTAFLYGELSEEIYMQIPEGYDYTEEKVCKLKKSLYGLKQSPLKWNQKFSSTLKHIGLKQLDTDPCIFKTEEGDVIFGIYVDDGILIGKDKSKIKKILNDLEKHFEMTYCENPISFLGIEIKRKEGQILLGQEEYASSIIEKFNMNDAKSCPTPLVKNNIEKEKEIEVVLSYPYREAIGSLMYLNSRTRPDLSFAVNYESRFLENPTEQDVKNVKRTLRYIQGHKNINIGYETNSDLTKLEAYSDSDFAGDTKSRRSTSGYIIMFCGGPIQWCSRKQPIVALSSCEAEYIAAAECCKELLYLKSLLQELLDTKMKATLYIDNQSAIKLVENGVLNRRSKHIDVRYKFIHEKVVNGEISVAYVPTTLQYADILTKPLEPLKFKNMLNCITKT